MVDISQVAYKTFFDAIDTELPKITDALLKKEYSEADVEKILERHRRTEGSSMHAAVPPV